MPSATSWTALCSWELLSRFKSEYFFAYICPKCDTMARKTIYLRQGFNNKQGKFITLIETNQEAVIPDHITGLYEVTPADIPGITYSIPGDNIAVIENTAQ